MSPHVATPIARAKRRAESSARVQHLVTADESALLELEAFLATLPMCATGRVYVEVPDETWITSISAPARMTVSWLPRNLRSGYERSCPRGAALARAACAWADEMLCEDQGESHITLLGGFLGTADIVDHLRERGGISAAKIDVPARFGQFLALSD